jgi:hypothetical protein
MKNTILLAGLLALSACAPETAGYPSLGVRPVEKLGFGEPEVKTAVATSDPALDAEIAKLSTRLDGIAAGFAKDARTTETAAKAARGDAVGSESWLTAQTALAGLDDWRAQSSALVGDVDQRATDRAATLEPDYPALSALRERAQAENDRQGATIARIQAMLPAA